MWRRLRHELQQLGQHHQPHPGRQYRYALLRCQWHPRLAPLDQDSTTTITTYAFGAEEHTYSSSGTLQSNTFYYSLGGQLIGELTGTTTQTTSFFLTDGLGSILATFSNTVNTAAVLGNQVYGPYGTQRYDSGSMGTTKGFTGQYADATGLDYYNARYYDPSVGVFLSGDVKQGNMQGMNPYDYVGGNP